MNPRARTLVCGVTIGASARSLLRGQLAWFSTRGWEVTLVTSPDDAAHEAAQREGVTLVGIPMTRRMSPFQDLKALVAWIRHMRRLQPDAVNVSTPKAGLLGAIAARITGVPRRLYIVRGIRLEGTHGLGQWVLWLSEWLTMMLATDVFFVSRSLAAKAQELRLLDSRKAWLIGAGSSNGVDAAAVSRRAAQVDGPSLREELGFRPQDFVVGFVGRVTRDKGIETLLTAFESPLLDERARLLLIGPVADDELQTPISRLSERVTSIGPSNDVWGLLKSIDVLCLPTRREGFPNVVLEAASVGIPTVTTRATGAVDSVVDRETGLLIDVDDSQELVNRINELVTNPVLVRTLGENARSRAIECFKPEDVWAGVEEILKGDLAPTHARPIHPAMTGENS